MLDLQMVRDEIEALEQEETTYETCERLAALYTVRDVNERKANERKASESSEFLAAAVGAPLPDLMRVMDEHMQAIRALYPQEYDAMVKRLKALHE